MVLQYISETESNQQCKMKVMYPYMSETLPVEKSI